MSRKLTRVDVNSVNISSPTNYVINWSLKDFQFSEVSEIKIKSNVALKSVKIPALDVGMTIEVWEGFTTSTDTKVFDGIISDIKEDGREIILTCKDKLWTTIKRQVNKDYDFNVDASAGKISEIFKDLINSFTDLTADGTSVQDSGTVFILKKFVCSNTDVFERLQILADALNWQFYYDSNTDLVYFEPKGFTTNTNTLYVGGTNNNVAKIPKWKTNMDDLINIVQVDGVLDWYGKTELFTGDAAEDTFTLGFIPEAWTVFVDSGAGFVEQVGGKEDTTTGVFDYTVDKRLKTVIFESGSIPPVGVDNIKVEYFYGVPSNVSFRDDPSISSYGESKTVITFSDITSVDDAETRARKLLTKFSTPFVSTKISVPTSVSQNFGLVAGQKINVVDAKNSITREVVINEFRKGWPETAVEIVVGDREWRIADFEAEALKKFKRIEEELFKNQGFVNNFLSPKHSYDYARKSLLMTVENPVAGDTSRASDSDERARIYNSTNSIILDGLASGVVANWSDQGATTLTITQDTATSILDSNSMKVVWADVGGQSVVRTTQSFGDLSDVTGVNSGTPVSGTSGLWIHTNSDTGSISNLALRIGSSLTDYFDYTASLFSLSQYYDNWNYVVFDLDSPDASSGTVDWTAVDFVEIRFTVNNAGTLYFNYLTSSVNDTVGSTGVGERNILIQEISQSY